MYLQYYAYISITECIILNMTVMTCQFGLLGA